LFLLTARVGYNYHYVYSIPHLAVFFNPFFTGWLCASLRSTFADINTCGCFAGDSGNLGFATRVASYIYGRSHLAAYAHSHCHAHTKPSN
jgi:hypothetical protein